MWPAVLTMPEPKRFGPIRLSAMGETAANIARARGDTGREQNEYVNKIAGLPRREAWRLMANDAGSGDRQ